MTARDVRIIPNRYVTHRCHVCTELLGPRGTSIVYDADMPWPHKARHIRCTSLPPQLQEALEAVEAHREDAADHDDLQHHEEVHERHLEARRSVLSWLRAELLASPGFRAQVAKGIAVVEADTSKRKQARAIAQADPDKVVPLRRKA